MLLNFCNIHRKKWMLESLLNKVASLKPGNLIKKRLQHRYLYVKIAQFSRTASLQDISGGCFCCLQKIENFFLSFEISNKQSMFYIIIKLCRNLSIEKKNSLLWTRKLVKKWHGLMKRCHQNCNLAFFISYIMQMNHIFCGKKTAWHFLYDL